MTQGFLSEPDGVEVVVSSEQADTLVRGGGLPPLLVLQNVELFLDSHGLGEGPLQWQRIGDGQSNITYRIRRGQQDVVLRRGPRPPIPRSTHDMLREARVQQALGLAGVPVPKVLAVCEDESLLGVPFYVLEYLRGEILIDSLPPAFDPLEERRRVSESLVDTLAQVHAVDHEAVGLGTFGRPEGYLERQIATFSRLATQVGDRPLPLIGELATWLERTLPTTQRHCLVHGDYRLGNLMYAPAAPAQVLAILDWEMSTLGDPLADLGYLSATYCDPGPVRSVMEISTVTAQEGFLTREEIAQRYAGASGLDVSELPWYEVLALWKASVFLEQIYTRWTRGERPGDWFAPTLEQGVPELLEVAQSLT